MELYAWDLGYHRDIGKFTIAVKMRQKNPHPIRRRSYSDENNDEAIGLVASKTIRQAAEKCGLPESTLRSHLKQKHIHGRTRPKIFSDDDEKALVDHLVFMSECGYGLSRGEVMALASELLSDLTGSTKRVGKCWLSHFLKRWPCLRLVKPRKLAMTRARITTKQRLDSYYSELGRILDKYNLKDKPHLIFNMYETGFNCEHNPLRVISGVERTQAITSCRSATTIVIACGSAAGVSLPPYFILKGKRDVNTSVKEGCLPGSKFEVSDSGWSNGSIFRNFISNRFLPAVERDEEEYCLLLYDGHKSHITVPVIEEARKNRLILFLLPPHTSHLLQPLDVGCFGPMTCHYNRQCASYLSSHPGMVILRHNIIGLISLAYLKSMTHINLEAAFRKTGVCPIDTSKVDTETATRPSAMTTPPDNHPTRDTRDSQLVTDKSPSEKFLLKRRPVRPSPSTTTRKRKAPSYESGGVAVTENGIFLKIFRRHQQQDEHHQRNSQQAGPSRPHPRPVPPPLHDKPCCQCKQHSSPLRWRGLHHQLGSV
ncbi:uncharacterized protein LOC135156302 [Lytechinus pictus]|uniref:uncharacterized protein LOC135156302 n=1 Tax=Lytechinus pictus TaxID=7653 RepID=UPI0030B9E3D8